MYINYDSDDNSQFRSIYVVGGGWTSLVGLRLRVCNSHRANFSGKTNRVRCFHIQPLHLAIRQQDMIGGFSIVHSEAAMLFDRPLFPH